MSGAFAFVGKKILAESARNHFGSEDPYFEEVPASRLYRAFGKKTQRRRKAAPPGLSENDTKILTRVKRRAYRLDYSLFNLCGIKFGWGSVIGIVPFIGDAADGALALMVLHTCEGIDGGLPSRLRMLMMMNIIIDFFIGLVPFVGDIADAMFKCNTRNAIILEKYLRQKGARAISSHEQQQGRRVDPSLPNEFDQYDSEVTDSPRRHRDRAGKQSVKGPAKPPAAKRSRGDRRPTHQEGDLETGIIDDFHGRK
ncbi:hypothetical protein P175DRAFT_0429642 [Aspergillus ochraceoroseus IBT 24754]|uniref:PH domain protein n=2 Tax=Aspergillus ochraceoroseus TaxID=138278 RepID=A0A2T5MAG1_9EURO|nr:uncharacterized protein P175DRAFT_0429642 [Aspergillus ochraceoroseus IBT 24754]KKK15482.1 hypothetical protein AOCH_006838 [Aspergillus ochraceoroseus]PTU25523.1 hypothetical protein P175DRAFT_0429642 [Aspergillus ochraceoroseus IBT 24754]